jgi:hypothetical protein
MKAWVPDLFYRFPTHPRENALETRQCLVVLLAIGLFTTLLIVPASATDVRPGIHPTVPF